MTVGALTMKTRTVKRAMKEMTTISSMKTMTAFATK
jgi:hypothetical protein